jgi:2',3'-cyclic-nucleotide 2'-phosphodiesterase (5'-nucleotidase family)
LIDKNPTNSIFLNAGDYFQGTMWYTILKWKPVVTFANMLNFTAYTLGNHDFDDGIDGLMPFLSKVNFPVLAANLDASKVPKFAAKLLLNSFSYRSTYHSA